MTDEQYNTLLVAAYAIDRHVLWLCGFVLLRIFAACQRR